jgi:purine-binding chemotaxis protein CheW
MAYDDVDDQDFEDDDNIENTFLTFAVGQEEYAIHVAHVTEIVRFQKVFAVPDVARHIRGVINLRGKVIPLLDVRARFGLDDTVYTDRTVIVVIEHDGSPTGLVVDAVFDIAEIAPAMIEPTPTVTRSTERSLITGMSKRGDRINFVVDVARLVQASPLADTIEECSDDGAHAETHT